MPERADRFDAASVRADWDHAADAYAESQAARRDYYRFEFFGPAQVALCGDVRGLRLLDIGCGTGYFAREMARGGASVTGVELSPAMLRHAHDIESRQPLGIRYLAGDAAHLQELVPSASFDITTSCLALQDMPDIPRVLRAVHTVLVPGGRFVTSIAHPCSDTPFRVWEKDAAGAKRWLCIDRYFERGPLRYAWTGWAYEFRTTAYHATLEDWFGWILEAGFVVRGVREPVPGAAALEAHPDLEDATRVPYYLFLDLQRSAS
jgi:SAM-dependent methyltransferase